MNKTILIVIMSAVLIYFLFTQKVLSFNLSKEDDGELSVEPISPTVIDDIGPNTSQSIVSGIGVAGSVAGGAASVIGSVAAEGSALSGVGGALAAAGPWLAAAGFAVLGISKIISASNPQAYDTITGEIKKHFGVNISKEDVVGYYNSLGFTTSGDHSAYRFAVQIILSPMMLLYLYSVNKEEFLTRLKADYQAGSKGYVYGQDWTIPLMQYLTSGDSKPINDLWLSIFLEKIPSWFRLDKALIPG